MALVEVASKSTGLPVKLADISESQEIPLNYLEQIFLKLKRADIVGAVKGPGGGYLLKGDINHIFIVNIIDAVEENTKMTRCGSGRYCTKDNVKCKTHNLWKGLGKQIRDYLSSVSIADVLAGNISIK